MILGRCDLQYHGLKFAIMIILTICCINQCFTSDSKWPVQPQKTHISISGTSFYLEKKKEEEEGLRNGEVWSDLPNQTKLTALTWKIIDYHLLLFFFFIYCLYNIDLAHVDIAATIHQTNSVPPMQCCL